MPNGTSISEIIHDAGEHLQSLIQSEIRLAKAEVSEQKEKVVRSATLFGAGAVFALGAYGLLLTAAVVGLSYIMPLWLSALIIGVILGVIAAALIGEGRHRVRQMNAPLERTVRTVKENLEWARHPTESKAR